MKVLRTFECVIGHTYVNRNGTVVPKDTWDKALMNHCGTIFCYLCDSTDSFSIKYITCYNDPTHVCSRMREYTISNENVHATFDILDTECGMSLNRLIDSGGDFEIYPIFTGYCSSDDINISTITGFGVILK